MTKLGGHGEDDDNTPQPTTNSKKTSIMQHHTPLPLLLALCLLLPVGAQAQQQANRLQDYAPQFEVFTLPSGDPFAANYVQCVAQDSLGVLWFATQDGLRRYDGRNTTTLRHDPLHENSLVGNYAQWIHVAKDGTLWVADYGKGLTHYDQATGKFTRYRHYPNDPNSLSSDTVAMVVEDQHGHIWAGTHHGLNRLDRKTGTIKRYLSDPSSPNTLSANLVRALYIDRQGTLWVGCGFPWDDRDPTGKTGGLNRYHPDTETFTRYLHDPANPNSLADNRVRALFEDSRGNFWVGTMGAEGLQQLDRNTGVFTRLPANPNKLGTPFLRSMPLAQQNLRQVLSILEDKNGWLWIGSMSGLDIYDPATGSVRHFEEGKNADSLPMNFIWNLAQTRDGSIWMGGGITGGKAVKVTTAPQLFAYYDTKAFIPEVQALLEDDKGDIWFGGGGQGNIQVFRRERAGNQTRAITLSTVPNPDNYYNVFTLLHDPATSAIWACTNEGLFVIDAKTNTVVRRYRHDPNDPQSLSTDMVTNILKDRQGYFWVTTWGGGLHRLDVKTGKFRRFQHDPADPGSIGGSQVFGLHEDAQGAIWVGGGVEPMADISENPMFLDRYNPETGTFTHFLNTQDYGCACAILSDQKGNLWVLTMVQGIMKLNPTTGQIKKYNQSNSNIPTNHVHAIKQAPDGRIWLTSPSALIEFDPESEFFYEYGASHGMRISHLNFFTTFINKAGKVYFGGAGGFHAYLPPKVSSAQQQSGPTLRITGFKIANEPVVPAPDGLLRRPIWETAEIRLAHDQNVFAFTIACFDYQSPAGNRVEFMLENYDKKWRNDLRDGEVTYFNVPPGEYVFRVRGANSLGEWNRAGTQVRVVVRPPWWQTTWAYLLYAALALGLTYGMYHFLLHRRLAQAEAERLKELDTVKTRLYTNITHEFRTPLTIISGMAEQIRENPSEWLDEGLVLIKRNSARLLDLVNQMLDLAKLESGKMALHLQQGDVVRYLKYLVESFHSYAQGKGVQMHFLSDLDALSMDFDPERLQQIVGNLVSNAVKFTAAGGNVYLDVRCHGDVSRSANGQRPPADAPYLVIRVRDTGIGIPEEQLPYIFDRFYQATTPANGENPLTASAAHGGGSGIGLALTKELVKLMGGKIAAKSRPGEGAEFTVTLPVRRHSEEKPAPATLLLEDDTFPPFSFENQLNLPPIPAAQPIVASTRAPSATPLILLAEDNADVVAYLASCLAGDYRLVVAKDGQEAIELATEQVPDLLVTDVMMPRKDGFEVCRTLRADTRTSHIPIVMLTAKADMDSKLEGLEHGADVYLSKPFHKKELRLRIRKLLEMRQKLQQHYLAAAGLNAGAAAPKDPPPVPGAEDKFVRKVREIVDTHLDDSAFDVEQLCRAMAMSHSQLHRKLSALTGLAATKFIRHVRLSKAQELLRDETLTVAAVAYDTGFSDPSYFGRVFRQEFGVSPQEWREGAVVR